MHTGKYPEISYRRTVLKKMSYVSEGLKPGVDAAMIPLEDVTAVMSSNCILKWFEGCEDFYLQKTLNGLAEKGGKPKAIQLELNVPGKYDEKKLGVKIKNFNIAADKKEIPIVQVRVYKGMVEDVIAHITVIGISKVSLSTINIKPGMDLVMAGATGVGGTGILSNLCLNRLKEKFPPTFVRECLELSEMISVEKAAEIALEAKTVYLHSVSDCGVFGALWELGSGSNKGIAVNMKQIPVWQHTIEVAELLDVNPYMLEGTGAMLIVSENGQELAEQLQENNIFAAVIGQITENNDRIVVNGDETRYLEPPRGDELYKFL